MSQPAEQAVSRLLGQLELHRLSGLLLNDGRAMPSVGVDDELAYAQLHEITAPELAVDGNVGQRQVSKPAFPLKVEADRSNLLRLQWRLRSNESALVLGRHRPAG